MSTEELLIIQISLLVIVIGLVGFFLYRISTITSYKLIEVQLVRLRESAERTERMVREELATNREEAGLTARQGREELGNSLKLFADLNVSRMTEIGNLQKNQLDSFAQQIGRLTDTVEARLKSMQENNSEKLEQMRTTVDEKLHATLEQRLGESFKIVSERLEQVHKGLGEMQTLATGVGDLKKVLSNVKTRGIWGEFQLGTLLEQMLTPDQYAKNVATKAGSNERVEYAIKLPGRDGADGSVVWLPIDAKFPQEDYHKLLDAQEQVNPVQAEEAGKQLEARIKMEAKTIHDKYLDPPRTTDFGIMFLPVEGLYAEVLRRAGLAEVLQREYRVTIAGPTTLSALLNSLQMGFRTLAIEKRSSEVWSLLGAVKTEFGRFGDMLDKTQKKLQEASTSIEDAAKKSRTIARKLRDVQELPPEEAKDLIGPSQIQEEEME